MKISVPPEIFVVGFEYEFAQTVKDVNFEGADELLCSLVNEEIVVETVCVRWGDGIRQIEFKFAKRNDILSGGNAVVGRGGYGIGAGQGDGNALSSLVSVPMIVG